MSVILLGFSVPRGTMQLHPAHLSKLLSCGGGCCCISSLHEQRILVAFSSFHLYTQCPMCSLFQLYVQHYSIGDGENGLLTFIALAIELYGIDHVWRGMLRRKAVAAVTVSNLNAYVKWHSLFRNFTLAYLLLFAWKNLNKPQRSMIIFDEQIFFTSNIWQNHLF